MPRTKGSKNKARKLARTELVESIKAVGASAEVVKESISNLSNFVQVGEAVGLDGKPLPKTEVTTTYSGYPPSVKDESDKALYNAFINEQIITEDIPKTECVITGGEMVTVTTVPVAPTFQRGKDGLIDGVDYKYKNGKIDWQAMFNPEYLIYPDDDTAKEPMLRVDGLLDLADIRGVESKHVKVVPVSQDMVAVTVTISFVPNKEDKHGKTWSATADATPQNVGDKRFAKYLTTIAETRATGRCIRQALGIRLCTFEEISTEDVVNKEDTAPIKDTTLAIIKRQMGLKGFSEEKLLNLIHEKIAGTKDVSLLTQLTVTQGQRVVAYLNSKQNTES